jgi:hypothetical protein
MRGLIVEVSEKTVRIDDDDNNVYFLGGEDEIVVSLPPEEEADEGASSSTSKKGKKKKASLPPKKSAKGKAPRDPSGKISDIDIGSEFTVCRLTFKQGETVEFAANTDCIVTWLAKEGTPVPEGLDAGTPEKLRDLVGEEIFDQVREISSTAACKHEVLWQCPPCGRRNLFAVTGEDVVCSSCAKPFPPDDIFKGTWTKEEASHETHVLVFKPKQWRCPRKECNRVQRWFGPSNKPLPAKCTQCGTSRPEPEDPTYNTDIDHDAYVWSYIPTGIGRTSLAEFKKSAQEGHHSVDEIVRQGNEDFEKAAAAYEKALGCPYCKSEGIGCSHPGATGAQCVPFSIWYGLSGGQKTAYRLTQLQMVLNGIPLCSCRDRFGGRIGAVPKRPWNVFRLIPPQTAIDPDNRYWDKVAPRVTEQRPKLDVFDLVPVITDPQMKCHIVPRSAGGCFETTDNVIWIQHLCPTCQTLDALFTKWQGENATDEDDVKWACRYLETEEALKSKYGQSMINKFMETRAQAETFIQSLIEPFK